MNRIMLLALLSALWMDSAAAQSLASSVIDGDNYNFVLKATSHEYNNFWQDSNGGIRGLVAGSDVDQDGLYEIICSDYDNGGKVHVFEVVGDNQLQWIWSSPNIGSSTQTTCRYVGLSDLDNDSKQEILLSISEQPGYHSDQAGIQVYEWTGENNQFGSAPTAITRAVTNLSRFRCDSFFAKDIDKDGKQELVLAINGDGDQDYFVVLALTGTFEQKNVSWVKKAEFSKLSSFLGDAINVLWCDMDGDGHWGILGQSYQNMMILPIEVTGPNQYVAGTAFQLNPDINDVNLINGAAADINNDGKDEVFYTGWKTGNLYLLATADDALTLNANNATLLSRGRAGAPFASFGMAIGDQDHGLVNDGPDLYIGSGGNNYDFYDLEFTGGDIRDSLNYHWYAMYDDTTDGGAITTQVVVPMNDLDKDGDKELVLGYQSIPDSVDGQAVEKHWLRVLEYDFPTSVQHLETWTAQVPQAMLLVNNYPNPFAGSTTFALALRQQGVLSGVLFDILGKQVATLAPAQFCPTGERQWQWQGNDDRGQVLPNGIYFARFSLNGTVGTRQITIHR